MLFAARHRRPIGIGSTTPARWTQEYQRQLQWLGMLQRQTCWLSSLSMVVPQLRSSQPLWGETLTTLLGEAWQQQPTAVETAQRRSQHTPPRSPLAASRRRRESGINGDQGRRHPGQNPARKARANPHQRQTHNPSAARRHTLASAGEGPPVPQALQSHVGEDLLRKAGGKDLPSLPLPTDTRRALRKPPPRRQRPVPAYDSLAQQQWQREITLRALQDLQALYEPTHIAYHGKPAQPILQATSEPTRRTLSGPLEAITAQWQLTLDGPRAQRELLIRRSSADSARPSRQRPGPAETPSGGAASQVKGASPQGNNTFPQRRGPTAAGTESSAGPAARAEALQSWAGQRAPAPQATSSEAGMPAGPSEPTLDRLIREAASGMSGAAPEAMATVPGPGEVGGPVPAGEAGPTREVMTPASVLPATADSMAGPAGVVTRHLSPHRDSAAAHPGPDPLAERIKSILDEEARRHGIDV